MSQQKLLISNGKQLRIYDLDQPLMVIETIQHPLKHNGYHIMANDQARDCIRNYLQTGLVQIVSKAKKQ
jgi:hypothetical protein